VCARVRACAGAAESVYTYVMITVYIHKLTVSFCAGGGGRGAGLNGQIPHQRGH